MRKTVFVLLTGFIVFFSLAKFIKNVNLNTEYEVGQAIDSLNHVIVYYNGAVENVTERNTQNGYNIGLKYQCVEFVKRYYFEHFDHQMPDSYGHAKSFFNFAVSDGQINAQRNLTQYTNPSKIKHQNGDLIVMSGTLFNRYGHVAIISDVANNTVEIIQQNPGPFAPSREVFELSNTNEGAWHIEHQRIVGWLRKPGHNQTKTQQHE